jgi:hypothetical protein
VWQALADDFKLVFFAALLEVGSRGVAPGILNVVTRRTVWFCCAVNAVSPATSGWSRAERNVMEKRNRLSMPGTEPRLLSPQPLSTMPEQH